MKNFIIASAILLLSACSTIQETHGANLRKMAIEKIGPSSSRVDVTKMLGSPSTKSTYGKETWYYINNEQQRRFFGQNDLLNQEVMAISFDDAGIVDNVQVFGLDDAKNFDFVKNTTPTAGHELTIFEQLMGNVGKFNPKQRGAL